MELEGNGVLAEFMHVFIFSDTHGAFLDGCSGVAAFLSSYLRPLRSNDLFFGLSSFFRFARGSCEP
jgi:hypothetical protein